jgi:hypothetical protein
LLLQQWMGLKETIFSKEERGIFSDDEKSDRTNLFRIVRGADDVNLEDAPAKVANDTSPTNVSDDSVQRYLDRLADIDIQDHDAVIAVRQQSLESNAVARLEKLDSRRRLR